MDLVKETRKAMYATVGAGVWGLDTLSGTAAYVKDAWRRREQLSQSASDVYVDLAERGQRMVGRAQRRARRFPGVAPVEGEVAGVVADVEDVPIHDYESRTAADIIENLPALSQRELHMVEGYEARTRARTTVLRRIDELRGQEPWAGYDEMTVDEVLPRMRKVAPDDQTAVVAYERRHKQRRSITDAVEHQG